MPALDAAFDVALRHAVGGDVTGFAALRRTGYRLVDAVEAESRLGELAYHDRHHVAETVLAMGWLCGIARSLGTVTAELAALGVIAMVGHDFSHDGSPPNDGLLEARSARAVADLTCDLGPRQRAVIHAVILGTSPHLVALNAARAARLSAEGELGHSVDLVVAMANEADVFPSLLPNLGAYLTRRLVAERRAAGYDPSGLDGPEHRRAFLLSYQRLSLPARSLGLADLCAWQIRCSEPPPQPAVPGKMLAGSHGFRALKPQSIAVDWS